MYNKLFQIEALISWCLAYIFQVSYISHFYGQIFSVRCIFLDKVLLVGEQLIFGPSNFEFSFKLTQASIKKPILIFDEKILQDLHVLREH